jgi:hypothetical protein
MVHQREHCITGSDLSFGRSRIEEYSRGSFGSQRSYSSEDAGRRITAAYGDLCVITVILKDELLSISDMTGMRYSSIYLFTFPVSGSSCGRRIQVWSAIARRPQKNRKA